MIVVTTPTGDIGGQVLTGLLDRGEDVRVVVRDPARLPARDRVEVVVGSHGDPDVAATAFAGADAVLWVAPPDPRAASVTSTYLDFTGPVLDALASAGRVVCVSALGRGYPGDAGHVTASLAMDDLIAGTGVPFRAVACPSFMDNWLRQTAVIRDHGVFSAPVSGDRAAPTCATRDIAATAVGLLVDDAWQGAGSVAVLGPEDLSHNDMARVMSDVLGRRIRFERVPDEAFTASLLEHGMSEPMARAMLDMMRAKDNGLDNLEPRTPENTTPTSFRQWCEEVLRPAVLG